MRRHLSWCLILLAALFGGCASDKVHTLKRIDIVPNVVSLPAGYTQRYVALGAFEDDVSEALTDAVWASSETSHLTIAADGTATGILPGGAMITATRGKIVGNLAVTVSDAKLVSLGLDPPTASVPMGVDVSFTLSGHFSDGSSKDLTTVATWASSNDAMATVANGLAHAVAAGALDITATHGDMTATAHLTVTAATLSSIEIAPAHPSALPIGRTQAFTATGIYSDHHTVDLTANTSLVWSSSAPGIADLTHTLPGVFRGNGLGLTMIRASYGDANVVVDAAPVALAVVDSVLERIEVSESVNIPIGYDSSFRATGFFSNGLVRDITDDVAWSSDNTAVATISNVLANKGVAVGLKAGAVAIYAKSGDITGEGSLRVTSAHLVQIHIDPPTFDIEVAASRQLVAIGNFDDGSTLDLGRKVEWAVDPADLDRAIFVSNAAGREGLVTILPTALAAPQPFTIWASYAGVTGRTLGTVISPRRLVGIVVTVDPGIIPMGLTARATAIGLYTDDVHPLQGVDISDRVLWSPVIGGVATVSNTPGIQGVVTGLAEGAVEINACYGTVCANDPEGVGSTYVARVTSCPLDHVSVAPPAAGIPRGTSRQLEAHAFYATQEASCEGLGSAFYDVTNLALWHSTNHAVATVSNAAGSKGLVTAAAAPAVTTTEIDAVYRSVQGVDLMGSASITVLDACIDQIAVAPATTQLPVGVRQAFVATAHLTDGTSFDATIAAHWQVSGALALVAPGLVETFRPFVGVLNTVIASFEGSESCPSVSGSASVGLNTKWLLTEVTVAPETVPMTIGSTEHLTAYGRYSNGETYDLTDMVTWTSSNPDLVGVRPNGDLESYGAGSIVIVATYGRFSGVAHVFSGGITLDHVVVTAGAIRCGDFDGLGYPTGARLPLIATGTWSDGGTQFLGGHATWTSSDPNVATVDAYGLVVTIAPGTTLITAKKDDITGTFTVHVVATTLTGIEVEPGNGFVLPVRSSLMFHATGSFDALVGGIHHSDACDISLSVQWMAVPAASLTINGAGRATSTATATHSALVTATREGVVGSAHGVVSGTCVNGLRIVPSVLATSVGLATQYAAQALMSDGTIVDVTYEDGLTWSSSDAQIASVNDGRATPYAAGTVYIYATYLAGEAACPDQSDTFAAFAQLDVGQATLNAIQVTCEGADTMWPSDAGDVPGLPAGVMTQCHALGHYGDGATADITGSATWRSSQTGVLAVSDSGGSKGRVTTQTQGTAQVSASLSGIQGGASINVVGALLTGIAIDGPTAVPVGLSEDYHAFGRYTLAPVSHYYDLTALASWASSDAAKLRVSDSVATRGRADALVATAPGATVSLTASYKGKVGTMPVAVLGVVLNAIAVSPRDIALPLGQSQRYIARGTFIDPVGGGIWEQDVSRRVTWRTTDATVAIIDTVGLVTAVGEGDAIVTADLGNVSGSTGLAVTTSCIERLELSADATVLPAGTPDRIKVSAYDSSGNMWDVTGEVMFQTSDASRMPAPDATGWTYARRTATAGTVRIDAMLPAGGCDGRPVGALVLTVSNAQLNQLIVVPVGFDTSLPVGMDRRYFALGVYGDGMVYDVTRTVDAWTTGNAAVATVSNAPESMGLVTGLAVGKTPVIATQGRVSAQRYVDVVSETLVSISVVGFDNRGACRSLSEAEAWIASDFREPMGGMTTWVRALGHLSNGNVRDITGAVTWSSSALGLATVDNGATAGRVTTGQDHGIVRLTAQTSTGLSSHIDLRVDEVAVERIAINPDGPDPLTLIVDNDAQLDVRGVFDGVAYCVVTDATYVSSKTGTVRVSNAEGREGRVSASEVGNGIVTAMLGGVNDSILVEVQGANLVRVAIAPSVVTLARGETAQLRLLAYYDNGMVNDVTFNQDGTWQSLDNDIVATSASPGVIVGVAAGSTYVDACLGFVCASDGDDDALITVGGP